MLKLQGLNRLKYLASNRNTGTIVLKPFLHYLLSRIAFGKLFNLCGHGDEVLGIGPLFQGGVFFHQIGSSYDGTECLPVGIRVSCNKHHAILGLKVVIGVRRRLKVANPIYDGTGKMEVVKGIVVQRHQHLSRTHVNVLTFTCGIAIHQGTHDGKGGHGTASVMGHPVTHARGHPCVFGKLLIIFRQPYRPSKTASCLINRIIVQGLRNLSLFHSVSRFSKGLQRTHNKPSVNLPQLLPVHIPFLKPSSREGLYQHIRFRHQLLKYLSPPRRLKVQRDVVLVSTFHNVGKT